MTIPLPREFDGIEKPGMVLRLHGYRFSDEVVDRLEDKAIRAYISAESRLDMDAIAFFLEHRLQGGLKRAAELLGYKKDVGLLNRHIRRGRFGKRHDEVLDRINELFPREIDFPSEEEKRLRGFISAMIDVRDRLEGEARFRRFTPYHLALVTHCSRNAEWISAMRDNGDGMLVGGFEDLQATLPNSLFDVTKVADHHELVMLIREWRPSLDFCRVLLMP